MGKKITEELIKERDIDIPKTKTITVKLYEVSETNKGKSIKYKKILLKNKSEKFSFYERFCYRTVYDKNENPIGSELLSNEELIEAIDNIVNNLYKPFNLKLDDFTMLITLNHPK